MSDMSLVERVYMVDYCEQSDAFVLYCLNGLKIKLNAKYLRS